MPQQKIEARKLTKPFAFSVEKSISGPEITDSNNTE